MERVGVTPAGSFGTAIAAAFARSGHEVTLGFRDPQERESFEQTQQIDEMPGVTINPRLNTTTDIPKLARESDLLVVACPMKYLRNFFGLVLLPNMRTDNNVLLVPKGFELATGFRPSQIIADLAPKVAKRTASMGGPNFAPEIAKGLPALTVVASWDGELAERIAQEFSITTFRIYPSDDQVGLELGGGLKHSIVIAAGASDQLGMGASAKAGLINRGEAEVGKVLVALGGRESTFNGLSGRGDLEMSCWSPQSRNHYAGTQLVLGRTPKQIEEEDKITVEGFNSTPAITAIARSRGIDMPITFAVERFILQEQSAEEAMFSLLKRGIVYEDGRPLGRAVI